MEIEQVKKVETPEEMRAELFRLSHYDALVRRVMDTADYNGLNAEDRYTLLAYYAIAERNLCQKMILDVKMVNPAPSFVFPAEPPKELLGAMFNLRKRLEGK